MQLEDYMTEDFLRNSMSLMGEEDSLVIVKRIRNKYNGALATYGFLTFESDASERPWTPKIFQNIGTKKSWGPIFQLNKINYQNS